jgi:predicted TIM-barrel enzyme
VVAAATALTAGCGIVHVHFGSDSSGSVTFRPNAAFVQCMRSHGLTKFPNANPSRNMTVQLHGNTPVTRAYDACKHLL